MPISSLLAGLRPARLVYLQVDEELVAGSSVRGIGFRERRWRHAAPDAGSELGPGATIEVDGWGLCSVDLGPDGAVPVSSFRYVTTATDGAVRVVAPDG